MFSFFKTKKGQILLSYLQICFGAAFGALAYPLFLVPHHIAPGGVTGLATVFNHIWSFLPVGITSLTMNVPLFIFGYKYMGRQFVIRTFAATIVLSILIDIFKFEPITQNPLMAAIFGGALLGVGLSIILSAGATTGGTDMLARMVYSRFPGISVGGFLFLFDCFVIFLAGLLIHVENAMYAMVCVFICSRIVDSMLAGVGASKACYIFSSKYEEIAEKILKEVHRGATLFDASGAYSKQERKVLLCIVGRMEVVAIKRLVREIDPVAFMFISDTKETLGEGFLSLNSQN